MLADFRRALILKCQNMFETEEDIKRFHAEVDWNKLGSKESIEYRRAVIDVEDKVNRAKDSMKANVRFIGELFKIDFVKRRVIFDVVKSLLDFIKPENKGLSADVIECRIIQLIEILEITGATLSKDSSSKPHLDIFFKKFKKLSMPENTYGIKVLPRLRFTLIDLIDLRGRNWVVRGLQGETAANSKKQSGSVDSDGWQTSGKNGRINAAVYQNTTRSSEVCLFSSFTPNLD